MNSPPSSIWIQKTYGAIGGVMVALLWFYFSGLALLLGAQLHATIDRSSHLVRAEAEGLTTA